MKDKTVGRIDHSSHAHPDTPHERAKCRARMLAEAKGEKAVTIRTGRPKAGPASTPPPLSLDLTHLRGLVESLEAVEQELCGYAELVGAAVRLKVDGTPVVATFDGRDWSLSIG